MLPHRSASLGVRWLGNAHYQVQYGSFRLNIDPWTKTNPDCPVQLDQLANIQAVLVTHGHPGHFGREGDSVELARLARVPLLAPTAVTDYVVRENLLPADQVRALTVGETVALDGLMVTPFEAAHPPSLDKWEYGPPSKPNCGYVLQAGGIRVLHIGDAASDPVYGTLARDGQIDLALLTLWSPTMPWPEDVAIDSTADIIRCLRPRTVLIHGRYRANNPSIDLLRAALDRLAVDCTVLTAKPGDIIILVDSSHHVSA